MMDPSHITRHVPSVPAPHIATSELLSNVTLDQLPVAYQKEHLLQNMKRLAEFLLARRDQFDLVIHTGRSGVGIGLCLTAVNISCVEIPPLRTKLNSTLPDSPTDIDNRPAVPVPLDKLKERLGGKRIILADDFVDRGLTVVYSRLVAQKLGAHFVGVAMYKHLPYGHHDTVNFLLPNEIDVVAMLPGTGAYSSLARWNDRGLSKLVTSIYGARGEENPFSADDAVTEK